jgi:hypothetical protein
MQRASFINKYACFYSIVIALMSTKFMATVFTPGAPHRIFWKLGMWECRIFPCGFTFKLLKNIFTGHPSAVGLRNEA